MTDQEAVQNVHKFRNTIAHRFDVEPVSSLTPQELEYLDSKSFYELWTDAKGRAHIRIFHSRAA